MNKMAIVGYGFVGKALGAAFHSANPIIVDPQHNPEIDMEYLLAAKPEVVFVSVPTPMGADGIANTKIVETVFDDLFMLPASTIKVLKSTVVPSVIKKLETIPGFVYNPEFLTEANAVRDFQNPKFHVMGGEEAYVDRLIEFYVAYSRCAECPIIRTTPVEAAMIKYGINNYLATKVLFFNQWKNFCESVGANYDVVAATIGNDPRITQSHTMVPGADGRGGFGGSCFSKDIPAIIKEASGFGVDLSVLHTAWNANCDIRNSYDAPLPREVEQHITFTKIEN